jgi:hypothetical protein
MSSVMNFILSVGGTFVFGYMCSQYAFAYVGLVRENNFKLMELSSINKVSLCFLL